MGHNDFEGIAKLFMTGRSQAVRLPAACRFDGKEVFIRKVGNEVIISAKPTSWDDFFNSPDRVTADFMPDRDQDVPQQREAFE